MELTERNKKHIDNMNYEELLSKWRCAPIGSHWFEGETGEYWEKRIRLASENINEKMLLRLLLE